MTFGIVAMVGTVVQAQSGSLEPPGSAVNGSGDPVATTQTQPSWDQDLPANERFKLVLGGAGVLDKQTGLTWEQDPQVVRSSWEAARGQCIGRGTGGQMGWRLPSIHELTSLVVPGDPGSFGIDLPTGHPFSNVQSGVYWSASTNVVAPTNAWAVSLSTSTVGFNPKTTVGFVWCVRGGGPLSEY
ncbi:MAG: DUF1566 domain-containing protein [Gammaproteobacteria bacterium]|nr:DUF1566 domain-containing protein [Gammaproteobacteria bacterium]